MAGKTNPMPPTPEMDLSLSRSVPSTHRCVWCDHDNVMVVPSVLPVSDLELECLCRQFCRECCLRTFGEKFFSPLKNTLEDMRLRGRQGGEVP